ncbi:MAG: NAD(P)-dependent oxidoreductase [Gammaproteobacteria bacterium]|nr:NAD(P)-dependent oxidoreductase [Gammaproteobacteria bacterium]
MKVGFIGLGTMGAGIALNAIKNGYSLVVHDLDRASAARHLEGGATWAASPAEVGAGADVVFTSLPGPSEMEHVALGESGLIHGMKPGSAYFDLSTNAPKTVRSVHAAMGDKGIDVLDAPVSGGPAGANSGKLAIWVGGKRSVFDAHLPVLESMSDQPFYVGEIGTGSVAKLVHNCSGYILQTALAETFTMGVKAGVEPEALFRAIRHGALGRRRTFDGLAKQFLGGAYDPADFALNLARKDVRLAVEVGRDYDVPMRLANMTFEEMTEAVNRDWGHRDSRSAMLVQQERADVDVTVARDTLDAILKGE